MSNGHLVLILAIILVSVMASKNTTACSTGKGNDVCIVESGKHLIRDTYEDCANTTVLKSSLKAPTAHGMQADTAWLE